MTLSYKYLTYYPSVTNSTAGMGEESTSSLSSGSFVPLFMIQEKLASYLEFLYRKSKVRYN